MSPCVPMNKQCCRSFVLTSIILVGDKVCKANTCKQLQDIVDVYQLLDVHSGVCLLSMHRSPQGHANQQCHPCDLGLHPLLPLLPRRAPSAAKHQLNLASFPTQSRRLATPQLDDMAQMLKLQRYSQPSAPQAAQEHSRTKRTTGPIPRLTNTDGTAPSQQAGEGTFACPCYHTDDFHLVVGHSFSQLSLVPPLQTGISDGQTRAAPGVTPTPAAPKTPAKTPPTC